MIELVLKLGSSLASLRIRLLVLVLLAVVPALGLLLCTVEQQRLMVSREVQQEALRVARIAASNHQRLVEGARQLLITLAQLPALRESDSSACGALLVQLLQQYPQYANLGVIKRDGMVGCSGLRLGGPVNVADRAYFRRAVETKTFAVGEYQIGRISGKATVNFGFPILDPAGDVRSVVFAALDLAWLNQFTAKANLPQGAALTVIDRKGLVLVRYPEPDKWLGKPVPEAPLTAAARARDTLGGAVECPILSLMAGATALIPPGLDIAIDVVIVQNMVEGISERSGLARWQLEGLSSERKAIVFSQIQAVGAAFIGKVVTTQTMLAVFRRVGVRVATKSMAKVVPLAGQALSAVAGYALALYVAKQHIKECSRIARALGTAIDSHKAVGEGFYEDSVDA